MRRDFQSVRWSVARPRRATFGQATEQHFEDGIVAEGVGIVGIFIARSNVQHALLEQVVKRKVNPSRIAWVSEHRRQVAR